MYRICKAILPFSITLSFLQTATAWEQVGHQIVGGIAEQMIEPSTRNYIRGLLGIEPLAVAAIFPDLVRHDDRFGGRDKGDDKTDDINEFGDYHQCEVPYGATYDNSPFKAAKDCYGAITNSVKLLKEAKASREAQRIALRYLIHVVGDLHQPLHIGNGYDLGANFCKVRTWKEPQKLANLHQVWDDFLVEYLGETYADSKIKPARKAAKSYEQFIPNMRRTQGQAFSAEAKRASRFDVKAWIAESQDLRDKMVYPDPVGINKVEAYKNRNYCSWFSNQAKFEFGPGSPNVFKTPIGQIPLLEEATYGKAAVQIVESQLIKAGVRLAAVLDDIAEAAIQKRGGRTMDDSRQNAVLKEVHELLRNKE